MDSLLYPPEGVNFHSILLILYVSYVILCLSYIILCLSYAYFHAYLMRISMPLQVSANTGQTLHHSRGSRP